MEKKWVPDNRQVVWILDYPNPAAGFFLIFAAMIPVIRIRIMMYATLNNENFTSLCHSPRHKAL
jgi:hypothetical protein